jgi:hypothetical protein
MIELSLLSSLAEQGSLGGRGYSLRAPRHPSAVHDLALAEAGELITYRPAPPRVHPNILLRSQNSRHNSLLVVSLWTGPLCDL